MTRPTALVLDGNTIKLRLEADRLHYGSPVHVDWLRFTLPLRAAPAPSADLLFPATIDSVWHEKPRSERLASLIASTPDADHQGTRGELFKPDEKATALEALTVARDVCQHLGAGFDVSPEVRKGHDFYRYRWSITLNDSEVGWVGFLASSTSPRQSAQSKTIHVNLYGAACTFARLGWREALADYVDAHAGVITRVDFALDFFEGLAGGLDRVKADYMAGLCDVMGKRPKCNLLGDWCNGHGRSFYIGSKEAGKQTNVYEKGDQLFGSEAGSTWHRVELRYGNKLRDLPTDVLRRPADFFAGASDWHASVCREAAHAMTPEAITCRARVQAETVDAAAYKNLRWTLGTAAASVWAWVVDGGDAFLDALKTTAVPRAFHAYSPQQRREAMQRVIERSSSAGGFGPAPVSA